jgi:FkbM family methyltransferase
MLGKIAYRLVSALPASWLRRIGAWQWTGALQRRLVQTGSEWLRQRDVTIRHGAAAGLKFNAGGANPGYALGTTEPAVQEPLLERLRPGDVVYDVGANVGFFTVLAAHLVGRTGRVVAFEPLPANVAALRHNVELNRFDNVTIVEAAVAAAAGSAGLVLAGEPTWAKLAPSTGEPERPTTGGQPVAAGAPTPAVSVRLVSVDDLLASGALPPPTLVKIDVEGAELEVVAGMRATLRTHQPILLCEMHGKNREFAALLREVAYEARTIEGREPLESARWDVHVVAVPAPARERAP